ncbi:Hsp70 family protein [Dactylosporangium sp. CA-052675]|uniref:Hsp70 family protein n=1 Tax=Dactylosporangium sp. CA-052675 TaxID=3239927 RepID=UPI003D9363D7
MHSGNYRLGVDFGTSTTVAVLSTGAGPDTELLFDSSPLLPSGVLDTGTDLLTGADAQRAAVAEPQALEANPKRCIDHGEVWLRDRAIPVAELIGAVLRRVAEEARRVGGGPPAAVTLTHPATWSGPRLRILAEAAARAGLPPVTLVPEPLAAAAYFADQGHRLPEDRYLVVYDFGAGTFDVSVVRRTPAGFEVVAGGGLDDLGGRDLDHAVLTHFRTVYPEATDVWGRLEWPQDAAQQQAAFTLRAAVRSAKEQLSRRPDAELYLPLLDTRTRLTREEFERLAEPHLARTVSATVTTLREAAIPAERIGGVFLVGGSSRIPLAATLLHRALRLPPTVIDHPELVVARGSLRAAHTLHPARPRPAPAPVGPPTPQPPVSPPPVRQPSVPQPPVPPPSAPQPAPRFVPVAPPSPDPVTAIPGVASIPPAVPVGSSAVDAELERVSAFIDDGRVAEAVSLAEEMTALLDGRLGPLHPDTLAAGVALMRALAFADRREDLIVLGERLLPRLHTAFGPSHRITADAESHLCASYLEAGRPDEAIAVGESALAVLLDVAGADDVDTLNLLHWLMSSYLESGRTDEGLARAEQVLAGRERAHGPLAATTVEFAAETARLYRRPQAWPTAGRRRRFPSPSGPSTA